MVRAKRLEQRTWGKALGRVVEMTPLLLGLQDPPLRWTGFTVPRTRRDEAAPDARSRLAHPSYSGAPPLPPRPGAHGEWAGILGPSRASLRLNSER